MVEWIAPEAEEASECLSVEDANKNELNQLSAIEAILQRNSVIKYLQQSLEPKHATNHTE